MMTEEKSFWKRPEGKTGMLFLAAAVIAGGFGLWHFLPILITLLENALYASLLAAATAVLFSPFYSKSVRFLLKGLMRKLTGLVIKIDPISIMKGYVDTLVEKIEKFDEQLSAMNGQIRATKEAIKDNLEAFQDSIRRAKIAKEQGNLAQAGVEGNQAIRKEEAAKQLRELLDKMEQSYRMMLKLRDHCMVMKQDIENEVSHREKQFKSINAAHGALKSAMSIINGGGEEYKLFMQTVEHLQENYANKMGEIETALTISEGTLASASLDNLARQEEALKRLEEMTANGLFDRAVPTEVKIEEDAVHSLYNR